MNDTLSNKEFGKFNNHLTVNVEQLAAMTGLSKWSIYHLVSWRRIPHVKIGRRVLFPVKAVGKWVEENTVHVIDR